MQAMNASQDKELHNTSQQHSAQQKYTSSAPNGVASCYPVAILDSLMQLVKGIEPKRFGFKNLRPEPDPDDLDVEDSSANTQQQRPATAANVQRPATAANVQRHHSTTSSTQCTVERDRPRATSQHQSAEERRVSQPAGSKTGRVIWQPVLKKKKHGVTSLQAAGKESGAVPISVQTPAAPQGARKEKVHHRALQKVSLGQDDEERDAAPVDPEAQSHWDALDEQLRKLDEEIQWIMLQWELGPEDNPSESSDQLYTYPLITKNGRWRDLLGFHDIAQDPFYDMAQVDREALQYLEDVELQDLCEKELPSGAGSNVAAEDTPPASPLPASQPSSSQPPLLPPPPSQTPPTLSPFHCDWGNLAAKLRSQIARRIRPGLPRTEKTLRGQSGPASREHSTPATAFCLKPRLSRPLPPYEDEEEASKCTYQLREKRTQVKYTVDDEEDSWSDGRSQASWSGEEEDEDEDAIETGDQEFSESDEDESAEFWQRARKRPRQARNLLPRKVSCVLRDSRVGVCTRVPQPASMPSSSSSSRREVESGGTAAELSNGAMITGPTAVSQPIPPSSSSSSDGEMQPMQQSRGTAPLSSSNASMNNIVSLPASTSQPAPSFLSPVTQLPQLANVAPQLPNCGSNSQATLLLLPQPFLFQNQPGGSSANPPTAYLVVTSSPLLSLSVTLQNGFSAGGNTAFQLLNTSAMSNHQGNLQTVTTSFPSVSGNEQALPGYGVFQQQNPSAGNDHAIPPSMLSHCVPTSKAKPPCNGTFQPLSSSKKNNHLCIPQVHPSSPGASVISRVDETQPCNAESHQPNFSEAKHLIDHKVSTSSLLTSFVEKFQQRLLRTAPSCLTNPSKSNKHTQPQESASSPLSSSVSRFEQRLSIISTSEVRNSFQGNDQFTNLQPGPLSQLSSTISGSQQIFNATPQQLNCTERKDQPQIHHCPSLALPLPRSEQTLPGIATAPLLNHAELNHLGNPIDMPHLQSSFKSQQQLPINTASQQMNCLESNYQLGPSQAIPSHLPPLLPLLSESEQRLSGCGTTTLLNHSERNDELCNPQSTESSSPLSPLFFRSEERLPCNCTSQQLNDPQDCQLNHSRTVPTPPPPLLFASSTSEHRPLDKVIPQLNNAEWNEQLSNPQAAPSGSLSRIQQSLPSKATFPVWNIPERSEQISPVQDIPTSLSPSLSSNRLPASDATLLLSHAKKGDQARKHQVRPSCCPLLVSVTLQRLPTRVLTQFLSHKNTSDHEQPPSPASPSSSLAPLTEGSSERPSSPQVKQTKERGYSFREHQKQVKYTFEEDDDVSNWSAGSSEETWSGDSGEESNVSEPEEEEMSEPEEGGMSEPEEGMASTNPSKLRRKGPVKKASSREKKVRQYQCPECPHTCTNASNMKKHVRLHTGECPYLCHVCAKAYSDPSCLNVHQRKHSSVPTFKCPKCEKAFFTKPNLKLHLRTHDSVRPFSCMDCKRSFASRVTLLQHMKRHFQTVPRERTFRCEECDKAFFCNDALRRHLKRHKSFSCDQCDAVFFRAFKLVFHKLSHN